MGDYYLNSFNLKYSFPSRLSKFKIYQDMFFPKTFQLITVLCEVVSVYDMQVLFIQLFFYGEILFIGLSIIYLGNVTPHPSSIYSFYLKSYMPAKPVRVCRPFCTTLNWKWHRVNEFDLTHLTSRLLDFCF